MNAFRVYCVGESIQPVHFSPNLDSESSLFVSSMDSMRVFGGFMAYMVEVRGVTPETAEGYKRNIVTHIKSKIGYCIKLGQDWGWLELVLNGLKKLHPHKKKRRDPMTPQILMKIRMHMDFGNHEDRTYWAVALYLMFGVSRKGDNLPETRTSFDNKHHVARRDLEFRGSGSDAYVVVARTEDKTSRLGGDFAGKPFPCGDGPLCTYAAISDMLRLDPLVKGELDADTPLFRHADRSPVTGPQLLIWLRGALAKVGENPMHYGTHSLRIGGATIAMTCPGASEYTVKMMGYWAGDSIRLYTRPTRDAILTLGKEMMKLRHVGTFITK